ncbi:WD40 repeat-like protein [Hymenopellis radicata]|nr:WD40 repeat-like protein [Hymenopellis radicata]
MSSDRRKEIEAKRAKLEELREARNRRSKLKNADTATPGSGSGGPSTPRRSVATGDVGDFINSIFRESKAAGAGSSGRNSGDVTPSSSIPGTPSMSHLGLSVSQSGRLSRQSDFSSSAATTLANSGTDIVMDRKERVIYSKSVQTMEVETETSPGVDDDLRQRLLKERDAENEALERELEAESVKLDEEIEQEIREIPPEELAGILAAPELLEFVDRTTKIFHRALNDRYDYIRDYRVGTEAGGDESEGRVKRVCEFWDERYGKNRSITDVDWSLQYPELSVASYNKNPAALNEPDGIVAVWNLHLLERPEFVFHSQSDVLSVTFSPFHSNLVFGGTYSGQILLWDNRSKHLPVLKTPLSAAGHTHPVYSMQMVGTQNAHNLITCSTDGTVCSWLVDMLAQPQETLELIHAGHNKTGEVAVTTLDFPDNETTAFWVGTEEGNVYQANRYDRAGAKAGLNQYDVYKGHAGPVMGLHFHPLVGSVDFSDLFLTSSVDWTVKLWRSKSLAKPSTGPNVVSPLYSFDEADDYVYDVKWHPQHPALFGTVPLDSTTAGSGRAINKLQWDHKDGRRVALGGSDGKLYVYDIGDLALPKESEWNELQKTISGISGGGPGVQTNGTATDGIVAGR